MTFKPKTTEAATETLAIAAPTVERATESMKQATATAAAGIEQAQTHLKTQMNEGVQRAMKTAEQFAHFGQGNMEAVMKSGQIWATGLQDLTKHFAATAQAAMDEGVSTFRALTTVKSLKEAMDVQASFARISLEKAMAESGKLTETSLKLAEQAYAPISARVNAAVETFSHH